MPAPSANPSRAASLKSFASTDRFLAEIAAPATLRPGYVLLGDEAFLYQRCRQGVLAALAPPEARDFSLHDFDLADIPIFDIDVTGEERLFGDGPAIARELTISLNTLRTHTRNIYAKLGVTSRRAAVRQAVG